MTTYKQQLELWRERRKSIYTERKGPPVMTYEKLGKKYNISAMSAHRIVQRYELELQKNAQKPTS